MSGELLCDASVVLKWFHAEREAEVAEARRLLDAHRSGELRLRLLELTLYEVANIVVRRLSWDAGPLPRWRTLCGSSIQTHST